MPTNLPEGFRIERTEHAYHTEFSVFEENGPTWPSGEPRSVIEVTLYHNSDSERHGPEVSWPSTSDKRPVLAFAVAAAIAMAAEEAHEWS